MNVSKNVISHDLCFLNEPIASPFILKMLIIMMITINKHACHRSPTSFVPSTLPPEQNSRTEALTQFLLYAKNVSLGELCRGRCQSDDVQIGINITTTVANSMSIYFNQVYCGSASDPNHDGGEKLIVLEVDCQLKVSKIAKVNYHSLIDLDADSCGEGNHSRSKKA